MVLGVIMRECKCNKRGLNDTFGVGIQGGPICIAQERRTRELTLRGVCECPQVGPTVLMSFWIATSHLEGLWGLAALVKALLFTTKFLPFG